MQQTRGRIKERSFSFPVKVMSAVFKKYYLRELKQLWEEKKLEYHGTAAHLKNHYEFTSCTSEYVCIISIAAINGSITFDFPPNSR